MTPEVKERIEQIRHGIVPEGYKRTKTDVVPEVWVDTPIAPYLHEYIEKTTTPNQHPVLTSARKGLMLQTEYYSNRQVTTEDNVGYYVLPYGYVTFRSRSDDGRFRFNENKIIDRGIISYFYPVFSFGPEVCHAYMLQLLNETIYRRMYPYIEGTAQQVLSMKKLGQLVYSLPPLTEQQRIAEVLGHQDKVIDLKEKLLEEKKRQKKYLMQQLLTGKKRLPGFDGEWMYVRANQIFRNVTDKQHDGTLEVLSATQDRGIIPRSQVDIDIKYAEESLTGYKKVEKGNFVISLRSFQGGIEYSEYSGIVSPAYTVLSSISPIEDNYYKQFFKSTDYISRLNIAVYGIRDGKQISYNDFGRIKIPYPPLDEQKAIATILSTADKEIDILKQAIEQEKQKKKALMQLLLTGIVRVNK